MPKLASLVETPSRREGSHLNSAFLSKECNEESHRGDIVGRNCKSLHRATADFV